jgi:hypothetical protein
MLPEIHELAAAKGVGKVCKAGEGEGKIGGAQSV